MALVWPTAEKLRTLKQLAEDKQVTQLLVVNALWRLEGNLVSGRLPGNQAASLAHACTGRSRSRSCQAASLAHTCTGRSRSCQAASLAHTCTGRSCSCQAASLAHARAGRSR